MKNTIEKSTSCFFSGNCLVTCRVICFTYHLSYVIALRASLMLRVSPLTRRVSVPQRLSTTQHKARALVSAFRDFGLRVESKHKSIASARVFAKPLSCRGSAVYASADSTTATVNSDTTPNSDEMTASSAAKLAALRERMAACNIHAFVVPSQDPHFSEYVPTCFERRQWISGFSGSAGTAVVTQDAALLWTDGRYFLQATQELTEDWVLMKGGQPGVPEPKQWLADNLKDGDAVGVDANVHSLSEARTMRDLLQKSAIELKCLVNNPVDEAWAGDRPEFPTAPIRQHPSEWAGKSVESKISDIRTALTEKKADVLIVSPLDEVAWLFNVRGGDLDFNPVALGYGIVTQTTSTLYVDEGKVDDALRAALQKEGVTVTSYDTCVEDIKTLAASGNTLWVDPDKVSAALVTAAESAAQDAQTDTQPKKKAKGSSQPTKTILEGVSPIPLAKAVKNESELNGMMEAHLRDGVAMASFWCWLDKQAADGKTHDEYEVGEIVREFRQKQVGFSEESFATIAGEGPHGAIIHYRASKESARTVGSDSLLLCDSGGQYECGTTDVTRTHHTGTPTDFQKQAYTRVLMGHIALASARFPEDTSGFVLDVFARSQLWQNGLDYRHGTGHGVGAALNVHEGPQSISPRFGNPTPLRPGMVLSNEPGYYEDGGFGIRIENLLVVKQAITEHTFGDKKYLEFYPLTHIPIQKKLIDWELMSGKDCKWLNEYHQQVWEQVSPRVEDQEVLEWLKTACKPVKVEKITVVVE